jgi:ABC-2 type transport system ATP-binding protein
MTAVPACEVDGLSKFFGAVPVFENLALTVMPGEVVAIVGPNGAGKTTLLRCVAGLADATAGTVQIAGQLVDAGRDQPHIRRCMGVAFDEPALYEDLTAWQHATFVAGAWGVLDVEPLFAELLDGFNLTDRAHDQVGVLSRGMRQKIALALALCHPADLLLIDEPFAGLDAAGRDAFLRQLDRVRFEGGAAIIATHALARVEEFADWVLDLGPDGAVLGSGDFAGSADDV